MDLVCKFQALCEYGDPNNWGYFALYLMLGVLTVPVYKTLDLVIYKALDIGDSPEHPIAFLLCIPFWPLILGTRLLSFLLGLLTLTLESRERGEPTSIAEVILFILLALTFMALIWII
jgi:hypothetical protein